ncbi:hypothetical protein ACWUXD_35005, partial [Klebsiella pneumoniae]
VQCQSAGDQRIFQGGDIHSKQSKRGHAHPLASRGKTCWTVREEGLCEPRMWQGCAKIGLVNGKVNQT